VAPVGKFKSATTGMYALPRDERCVRQWV